MILGVVFRLLFKSNTRLTMVKSKSLFCLTLKFLICCLVSHLSVAEPFMPKYPQYSNQFCSGFPQVMVSSLPNTCLGLVADSKNNIRMPRYAVQDSQGTIYFTDPHSFDYGAGSVFSLELKTDDNGRTTSKITNLFPKKKLTVPAGLLVDPEGRVYVGTVLGVYKFHPKNEKGELIINPQLELIEDGFMKSIFRKDEYSSEESFVNYYRKKRSHSHRHPQIQLAANANFSEIYLSVGSPSDSCANGIKTKGPDGLCIQSESSLVNAGIWKITLSGDLNRNKIKTEAIARGLRNSMGLAFHPESGRLYQAENSMDLSQSDLPFDEINLIEEGKHYGWPYCHSNDQVNTSFANLIAPKDCHQKYQAPLINLPAHVAPLSILFYRSMRIPNLNHKMLVSWHGYRENGHKIVSFDIDVNGLPTSYTFQNVVFDWDAKKGYRPQGAPVGLLQLNDGRILIMDDKNSSILILDKGTSYNPINEVDLKNNTTNFTQDQVDSLKPLVPLFQKHCLGCHDIFLETKAEKLLNQLVANSLIQFNDPTKSKLYQKIKSKQMPIGTSLKDSEYQDFMAKLDRFMKSIH